MNKAQKLDQLVSKVEDIFARLPDDSDPEIAALRDQVDNAILETWTAVARERAEAEATADGLAESLHDYIHAHPWLVLTAAVAIGVSASCFAGRIIGGYGPKRHRSS